MGSIRCGVRSILAVVIGFYLVNVLRSIRLRLFRAGNRLLPQQCLRPALRAATALRIRGILSGRRIVREPVPQLEILSPLADPALFAGGDVALYQTVAGHFVGLFISGLESFIM